ncbi:hypothetical protein A2V82_04420 [candidate division KSB1 bacterium RBG_16_48_16]|nr:MAG: hypothetical protein A2V82_04420 [candidate division KSB1 bacterium RBG_16_48_16]
MKSLIKIKPSWIIGLVVIVVGCLLVIKYNQQNPQAKKPASQIGKQGTDSNASSAEAASSTQSESPGEKLRLVSAVTCLDIDETEGKPLLPKLAFSKNVDYLFCYSEFGGQIESQRVFHRWVYRDEVVSVTELTISQENSKVWSKCLIPRHSEGAWYVDILSEEGGQLGRVSFSLN